MHNIKIDIPVLKARCILLIGEYEDIKDVIPYGAEEAFKDQTGYLARTSFKYRGGVKYPFTVVIHSKTRAISVIAHEAVHAAGFIQDAMGVVPDFNNDELTAYIVQHICEKVEKVTRLYD